MEIEHPDQHTWIIKNNGIIKTLYIDTYPNGQICTIEEYDAEGRLHGPCVEFRENGHVDSRSLFFHGQVVYMEDEPPELVEGPLPLRERP